MTSEGRADVVKYAVLHRDLKPANILLDTSNTLRITDLDVEVIVQAPPIIPQIAQLLHNKAKHATIIRRGSQLARPQGV